MKTRAGCASSPPGAGLFGLQIFLVSLGVLFAAGLVAYAIVRSRAESWRPPQVESLPVALWLSTLLLVVTSVGAERALRAMRHGRLQDAERALALTQVPAWIFLVSQAWSWWSFSSGVAIDEHSLYGFSFYMLTGLHALHVIGGMGCLGWVTFRAHRGDYSPEYHPGVRYNAIYWHFLGVVWLVLFGVLLVG